MRTKIKITKDNIRSISYLSKNIVYNTEKDFKYLSIFHLNKEKFTTIKNYYVGDSIIITDENE